MSKNSTERKEEGMALTTSSSIGASQMNEEVKA